jgi:hypothetical protein
MELSEQNPSTTASYDEIKQQFVTDVYTRFGESKDEISERNSYIQERDAYIYGDYLQRALNIPKGHDFTPANWLKRAVEIHKNMFMGRGFTVGSTYNTDDLSSASDDQDRKRKELENRKQKGFAESRMQTIAAIKEDNGGDALWATLAENSSAIGESALMQYWNADEKKVEQCQIENIENLYVLWNSNDFRKVDAYAYAFQVSKQSAISDYGAPEDVQTGPMGNPMDPINSGSTTTGPAAPYTTPMVTILEVTGKVEGWATKENKLVAVKVGQETPINVKIVGNTVQRLLTDEKKMPKYYLLPNKQVRRRPWGISDITDESIQILLTYIETLSDWRTVAAKVNFPKYKGLGFGADTQMPKYEARRVQILPLSENQDLQELAQGDANGLDWGRQLDEIEKLFIREVAVASVLFNDPSITLNSNQALTTSMKPTTDVAEAKKQLWAPIIKQIYQDALELTAQNMPELRELIQPDDNWTLKIMWPSVMEKDDPAYQTQLLNRFNAGLLSAQSYMETQGESKEEIDRIREEMTDPITAAILSHQQPLVAQALINAATAEIQAWFQMMQPATQQAQQSLDQGAAAAGTPGGTATPGINPNGGGSAAAQIGVTSGNQPGQSPMSQPGSGATSASIGGALAQTQQNNGQ